MAESNINTYCKICGQGYHVCNTCKNEIQFTPWRTFTDTINHYKIFIIIRDYTNKYTDKAETKKLLENCDLEGLETFEDNIREAIIKILGNDNSSDTSSDTSSGTVKNDAIVSTINDTNSSAKINKKKYSK